MRYILSCLLILILSFCGQALARTGDAEKNLARQLVADQGLFFALAKGDVPAMVTLRDQGADPNITLTRLGLSVRDVFGPDMPILTRPFDPTGWPILHWAVALGNIEAVKLLTRSGARVNAPDVYGATALHWAAWSGSHSAARLLLNNGANCQAADIKGRSPKDWAIMMSQSDMIRLLDSRTCRPAPPIDADRDGAPDATDLCPDTPYGAQVDERGCWLAAYANFFDFDKSEVKPEYLPYLAEVATVLNAYPELNLSLAGFTDSVGAEDYNMKLGQRRAEAVRDILQKDGVTAKRMGAISMGEAKPIADNAAASGRARNRRVEIQILQAAGSPAPALAQ